MHWFSTNNYLHLLRLCVYIQVWKGDALYICYLMFYLIFFYITIMEELEEDIVFFQFFLQSKSL